jgi:hypothetical protein
MGADHGFDFVPGVSMVGTNQARPVHPINKSENPLAGLPSAFAKNTNFYAEMGCISAYLAIIW